MPKPSTFGKYNDMNAILTDAQKADGWHYKMTMEEQWDKYGYVIQDQIRFRLNVKDGHDDVVDDYLKTEKKELIDINLPDSLGMTPLMWASHNGHLKVVAALLEANADLGIVDRSVEHSKITAIDYAKGYPHTEGCERRDDCVYVMEHYMMSGGQIPALE
eukprot:CAMPEP_0204606306 /NCGR_PEP_ID=MMETSP0661-20131031/59011_1 /ASSEMBLY_ACC=CAM_ASM_000606 /TAXON_ID=109239 /ORGANISM="Alexandrium margalefi, Strain AMGDE01CS-322" /LENGTH=159 /DNA_ID=CAMNT_0051617619 /DNA_START=61 /DNA_END=540 /DNA_ORIENTATION=+